MSGEGRDKKKIERASLVLTRPQPNFSSPLPRGEGQGVRGPLQKSIGQVKSISFRIVPKS